jgi:hypothetical protein
VSYPAHEFLRNKKQAWKAPIDSRGARRGATHRGMQWSVVDTGGHSELSAAAQRTGRARSARARIAFGTKRPWVQIPPPRPRSEALQDHPAGPLPYRCSSEIRQTAPSARIAESAIRGVEDRRVAVPVAGSPRPPTQRGITTFQLLGGSATTVVGVRDCARSAWGCVSSHSGSGTVRPRRHPRWPCRSVGARR